MNESKSGRLGNCERERRESENIEEELHMEKRNQTSCQTLEMGKNLHLFIYLFVFKRAKQLNKYNNVHTFCVPNALF